MKNITNPKKKELLDYLENTKIKIEEHKEVQAFFTRDGNYYQKLENHFKNKSDYEMLKLFFVECLYRYTDSIQRFSLNIKEQYFEELNINEIDINKYKNIDEIIKYRHSFIFYHLRMSNFELQYNGIQYFLDVNTLNYFINDERIKAKQGEENIYEILEKFPFFMEDLKLNIRNLINQLDDEKEIKEILKFLKKNMIFNILSPQNSPFMNYPKSSNFYVELDFSIPKENFIKYIERLYESYEKGNIQTYEEFLSELLDEKVEKKIKSVPLFLFNLKNEKKYPLYKKLVDLLFIYDSLKLGIKQSYIINKIETYRNKFYSTHKDFKSSFEKYKKHIISFIDNNEFNDFL